MTVQPLLVLSLSAAMIGACARPEVTRPVFEVRRDTVGDTVFVRTTSGSAWRGEVRLEEELSIGALEGADEYTFGDIVEVMPDGAGGLYVFDRQVPALRQYDHEGRFIRTLGGNGAGPGEYRASVVGMALRHDGRLIIQDVQNQRINVYQADGTPSEHWRISGGLFVGRSLFVDSADHTYVKILTVARRRGQPMTWPWPIGLLHLDTRGQVVDTMGPPTIEGEPESAGGPLSPGKAWALHPQVTVVGVNDTYAFEIRKPGGRLIRVSRWHDRLALSNDEWAAYEAVRAWQIRREAPQDLPPTTPRRKPAYRGFEIGQDGRIWVRKYMPVVRQVVEQSSDPRGPPPIPFVEPVGYDVFDADGTYLGEVSLPPRTTVYWIGSNLLYGVRRGTLDEQYVVRLRLITPP